MSFRVRIDESGEDRKRQEAFVRDHLSQYNVNVREEGNERFLVVNLTESELRENLPKVDLEEGKAINYDIERITEEKREPEERTDSQSDKAMEWANQLQKEKWALEDEVERLEAELEEKELREPGSIEEAVLQQAIGQSEDIRGAESRADNLLAREADVFEMAYRSLPEYVSEVTEYSTQEAEELVGGLEDSISDLESESEMVDIDAVVGAADLEDIPEQVSEAEREYVENRSGREALETAIRDAVTELGGIEIPVFDRELVYEVVMPVGFSDGALSYFVGQEAKNKVEKSNDGGKGSYGTAFEENSIRVRLEKDGYNSIQDAEDVVDSIYSRGDLQKLNVDTVEIGLSGSTYLTYDELSSELEDAEGWGESTARRAVEELKEIDGGNPLQSFLNNPVTLQESVSGLSFDKYKNASKLLEEYR